MGARRSGSVLVPVEVGIAWAGAGRASAPPWLVHSVSSLATVLFLIWLFRFAREVEERDRRRFAAAHAARILPFVRRGLPILTMLLLAPAVVRATPSTT